MESNRGRGIGCVLVAMKRVTPETYGGWQLCLPAGGWPEMSRLPDHPLGGRGWGGTDLGRTLQHGHMQSFRQAKKILLRAYTLPCKIGKLTVLGKLSNFLGLNEHEAHKCVWLTGSIYLGKVVLNFPQRYSFYRRHNHPETLQPLQFVLNTIGHIKCRLLSPPSRAF
jgi:hypothetical protein